MADSTVKVNFIGDASSLKRSLDDVDRSVANAGSSFSGFGKTTAAVFTGTAMQDGVKRLVSGLADVSREAREDEQAAEQLRKALQNSTGATDAQVKSIEKWVGRTQNATGVMDDDLRPALGNLVRATGDVGKAQDLMGLAMDISQATGKDLTAVSLALAKAHEGNVGGLQRLGISMKGANGEMLPFSEATAQLSELFGGSVAANTETTAGRMQILQARMADAREEIGARLNVALLAFADFIQRRVVPVVEDLVAWFREHWPEIRQTVEDVMLRVREVIETVLGVIQRFWATWGDEIMQVVRTLFNFVRSFIEAAMLTIQGVINVIMGLIHGDFSRVWEGIRQIFQSVWDGIRALIDLALGLMKAAISAGMTLISGIFDAAWEGIKRVVGAAIGAVLDVIGATMQAIIAVFQNAWWAMEDIARSVLEGIKHVVSSAIGFVRDIIESGMRMVQSVFQLAWWAMEAAVQNSIGTVLRLVGDLPGQILDWIGDIGGLLWNVGVDLIKGFIGGIGSMFGAVKDKLGQLTGALTGWKGPPSVDKKLLFGSGRMIIGGLVDGMKAEERSVQGYLSGLTGDIGGFGVSTTSLSGGGIGAMSLATGGPSNAASGNGAVTINNTFNIGAIRREDVDSFASSAAHQIGRELAVALRGSVN